MAKFSLSAITLAAKKKLRSKRRTSDSSFFRDVLLVFLAGSLSLGGVYLGGSISDNNTKRSEERVLRREKYNTYLNSANAYGVAGSEYKDCLFDIAVKEKILPKKTEDFQKLKLISEKECPDLMNRIIVTRHDYQGAVNDLFSVGTREAIKIHIKIAQHLPSSVSDTNQDGVPNIADVMNSDYSISTLYKDFLNRLCIDTRTDDLSVCTEDFLKQ